MSTLDLLGASYWVGEKGGQTGYPKHRIVYRSRSRWHVTWMHNAIPIPFALIYVLSTASISTSPLCVPRKNAAAAATTRTLVPPFLAAPMRLLLYQCHYYSCCCCFYRYHHRILRLPCSDIDRYYLPPPLSSFFHVLQFTPAAHLFPCPRDHLCGI